MSSKKSDGSHANINVRQYLLYVNLKIDERKHGEILCVFAYFVSLLSPGANFYLKALACSQQ
ncbi:hypothetical protein N8616_01370 [Verrucomicrobia bacterium]|nr:hypothetical protein [Verrucomicrobiota bacterium]MDB4691904.1 hypothetical protein [Verrucomicrobiota bacterium]